MLEITTPRPQTYRPMAAPVMDGPAAPASPSLSRLLAATLDEVDYGILLLDDDAAVLHLNHRARQWLGSNPVMHLAGRYLLVRDLRDRALLHEAVHAATQRGLRRLMALGRGEDRQVAALVPVEPGVAALVLGKSGVCEDLSLQCFARSHALTPAETRVLAALGVGRKPAQIASDQGVRVSTVRTQIGAIRAKTGAASITALLRLVAALPPMVEALRR